MRKEEEENEDLPLLEMKKTWSLILLDKPLNFSVSLPAG